jgi:hypothetical protein
MSKLALASRAATISMAISPGSASTMGRLDSVCGAMGTSTSPAAGVQQGPPADSDRPWSRWAWR